MSARLLYAEDEPSMAVGLLDVLRAKGYDVDAVADGDAALARAEAGGYDLLLLDVMMPGASGFDVLRRRRAAGDGTPVILLTARGGEVDRVLGFELGVDDYVTKPFSVLELLGRIQAVLRRSAGAAGPGPGLLRVGRAEVDLAAHRVRRDGVTTELPARAVALLAALARERGRVVSRDALIDAAWGPDAAVNQRTVNNLVMRLRQALEDEPEAPRHLATIHGVGYRLEAEDMSKT
jgi:DNA-binding response OmpR family regulator